MLQSALEQHRVELICLGGFMRLFTAEFVQRWHGRMLNIHPSLLPSFPGLDPQAQALRAGVKISGATVHFVIPRNRRRSDRDAGCGCGCDDDTPETLAARIIAIEHRIYPEALRLRRQRPRPPRGRYLQDRRQRRCAVDRLISPGDAIAQRSSGLAMRSAFRQKKSPGEGRGFIMFACADREEV